MKWFILKSKIPNIEELIKNINLIYFIKLKLDIFNSSEEKFHIQFWSKK